VTTPSNSSAELVRIKSRPRSAVMLHHRGSGRSTASSDDGGQRSNSSAALDLCYSASSDDEVQSLVGGGAEDSPLPLEFRTSPPEGAHRPTRSLSPPPKLFLADHHHHQHNQHESLPLSLSSSSLSALRTSPFGAAFNATQQQQQQQQHGESAALAVANGNAGSPRKRHRHTHHRSHSHGHHMQQRPCLDFEKMQQVSRPHSVHKHTTFFLFFFFSLSSSFHSSFSFTVAVQCALLRSVVTLYLFMYFPELSGEWRQANYFLRQEKANNSFLFSYSLLISIREWRREERRGMTRQLRHTVTTSYVTDGRFFFPSLFL